MRLASKFLDEYRWFAFILASFVVGLILEAITLRSEAQEGDALKIIYAKQPSDSWRPQEQQPTGSLLQDDQQDQQSNALPPYDIQRPIMDLKIDIRNDDQNRPEDESLDFLTQYFQNPYPRHHPYRIASWRAPDIRYQPLYFEDVRLERYGHSHGCILQPVVSSAHFFSSFMMFPYNACYQKPGSCTYPLGFCQPGSPVPRTRHHWFWAQRIKGERR